MEQAIEVFLQQGILGIGWVLAIWLILRGTKREEQIRDTIVQNTTALESLKTFIEAKLK